MIKGTHILRLTSCNCVSGGRAYTLHVDRVHCRWCIRTIALDQCLSVKTSYISGASLLEGEEGSRGTLPNWGPAAV